MMRYKEKQNAVWRDEIAADLNELVDLTDIAKDNPTFNRFLLPLMNVIARVAEFEEII